MATAKLVQKLQRRLLPAQWEAFTIPNGVDLQLDHDEARVLALILHRVGGHYDNSLRGIADRITSALRQAGYYGGTVREQMGYLSLDPVIDGSLYFKDGVALPR